MGFNQDQDGAKGKLGPQSDPLAGLFGQGAGPQPQGPPMPPPGPGPQIGGGSQDAQGPSERAQEPTQAITSQLRSPSGGGQVSTPTQPDAPQPFAAGQHSPILGGPVASMRGPQPDDMVNPRGGFLSGHAGGLLGGGMGLAGGAQAGQDPSDLLMSLIKLLGK